jgi:hypothetical protein
VGRQQAAPTSSLLATALGLAVDIPAVVILEIDHQLKLGLRYSYNA